MAELNKIFCGTDAKNTGVCNCFLDPKLITGAILIPRDRVLTAAELADIQDTLEGLTLATKSARIFPIQNFVTVTDSSEEPTNQTFGYGSIEPVREGNYNLIFQFRQGGVNLSNALRSFNGLTGKYAALFIENQNHLIGTKKKDADGADGMGGVPLEVLYTFPWKVNDGSNLAQYRIQFGFRPEWVNENVAYIKVPATEYLLASLEGLQEVVLTLSDDSAPVFTVTAETDCGSSNMYDLYADELAVAGAWVARNPVTGGLITVTGAPKNPGDEGWDVTLSAADPDYTTEPEIELAAAAALAVLNVVGYESDTLLVVSGS